jgi:hypothetical protein
MNKDTPLESGTECWFEYRCWESPDSSDAEIWYRSHQRVTVVSCRNPDEAEGDECDTYEKRLETAELLEYKIRFADGFEGIAIEDELLESQDDFCRPAPPSTRGLAPV